MRLIKLTIAWVAGIVAASLYPGFLFYWLGLLITALLVSWLFPTPRLRFLVPILIAFAAGAARYDLVPRTSEIALYNNLGGLTVEGAVVSEPDVRDDRIDLRVEVSQVTRIGQTVATSGLVLVQAPRSSNVHYGDRILATGILIIPSVSDTFSYRDYLARSGIFSIMQDAAVEVVSSEEGFPFFRTLFSVKSVARQSIQNSLPEPSAGLLTGILLGDARGLPPVVSDAFSAVGASHIIAISGFNMAILSGVVMRLLARARVRPLWAASLGIGVILLYTLFVGASPAVVRAAFMSSMLVVAELLRRKTYVPASLAFVTIVLSLVNPSVIWDVGFQLSLFATLGLALFVDPLTQSLNTLLLRTFKDDHAARVQGFLAEPLIVSIAAQITTLPLVLLYFERLSLVSLVVNLLIVPVQPYLLILGLLATLIAFFIPVLAQVLYWLDMIFLGWSLGVVRAFARLSFADVDLKVDPRLIMAYYFAIVGGALMVATKTTWPQRLAHVVQQRLIASSIIAAGLGIAALLFLVGFSRPDGILHVWWLDVGHSNAVLVQTPDGAHILVDGGRFPSRLLTAIGDRLPFTDRTIELLVISQPDPFDYSALSDVVDRYQIGRVLTNGQPNLRPDYLALLERFGDDQIVAAVAGYVVEFADGVRLEVLSPQQPPELSDSLNNSALVVRLRYKDLSFLLSSDISQEAQREMLRWGQWPLATVMQLPNHAGIRSLNQQFLEAVQPRAIVVQIDPTNRLGDPDADTLSLLGDLPVFRTDQSGTLHFWTNGQQLWHVGDR